MSLLRRFAKLSSSNSAAAAVVAVTPKAELDAYPACAAMCLAWLREHECHKTEGVFRLSGNNTVMLALYRQFQRGLPPASLSAVKGFDVHTCACLLKHYLRNLPEPICTYALFDAFVASLDVVLSRRGEGDVCFDAICAVVGAMPRFNRLVLCDVLDVLFDVSAHSELNKMSAMNLAIVMSGNLLSQNVDPITALMTMQPVVQVVELMITNWPEIKQSLARPAAAAAATATASRAAAPSMRLPTAQLTEAELRRIHSESVRHAQTIEMMQSRDVLELDDLPTSATASGAQPPVVHHGTDEDDVLHLNACLRRASLTRQDSILAKRRARANASAAVDVAPSRAGSVVEATAVLVVPPADDDVELLCAQLKALTAAKLAQALRHVASGRLIDDELDAAAVVAVRLLASAIGKPLLLQRLHDGTKLAPDAIDALLADLVELSACQLLQ